jgi:PAS domain S-box-containing protein
MDKSFLLEHYDEILQLLNCLKIGVYITDGDGNTLLVNDESCKTGGLSRSEVNGKNMRALVESGFVKESISLKTLASHKVEHMLQDLGDGGKVYATSHPVFHDGKIDLVITTERDITEMESLKDLLKEKEQTTKKYEQEIEYLKNRNIAMMGDVIATDVQSTLLIKTALRIAKLDTTVLLTGESGTGKEMFANLIYKNSSRVGKPFIKVSCAAIPETLIESELFGYVKGAFTGADSNGKMGYFELANSGTIFLDEIGELPMHLQSKFLRVLQEREVIRVGGSNPIPLDIRLIAATKVNLLDAVKKGTFREDLYYRINVVPLEIPPLRKRKQDISAIAEYFVNENNRHYKLNKHLTFEAIEVLEKYSWPGNIRELQNVIERSAISFDGDKITKFQIERLLYPKASGGYTMEAVPRNGATINEMLDDFEKNIIEESLKQYKNASQAASVLGLNKSTMSRRMNKYGLK